MLEEELEMLEELIGIVEEPISILEYKLGILEDLNDAEHGKEGSLALFRTPWILCLSLSLQC